MSSETREMSCSLFCDSEWSVAWQQESCVGDPGAHLSLAVVTHWNEQHGAGDQHHRWKSPDLWFGVDGPVCRQGQQINWENICNSKTKQTKMSRLPFLDLVLMNSWQKSINNFLIKSGVNLITSFDNKPCLSFWGRISPGYIFPITNMTPRYWDLQTLTPRRGRTYSQKWGTLLTTSLWKSWKSRDTPRISQTSLENRKWNHFWTTSAPFSGQRARTRCRSRAPGRASRGRSP